jgi:hypothetical protein
VEKLRKTNSEKGLVQQAADVGEAVELRMRLTDKTRERFERFFMPYNKELDGWLLKHKSSRAGTLNGTAF